MVEGIPANQTASSEVAGEVLYGPRARAPSRGKKEAIAAPSVVGQVGSSFNVTEDSAVHLGSAGVAEQVRSENARARPGLLRPTGREAHRHLTSYFAGRDELETCQPVQNSPVNDSHLGHVVARRVVDSVRARTGSARRRSCAVGGARALRSRLSAPRNYIAVRTGRAGRGSARASVARAGAVARRSRAASLSEAPLVTRVVASDGVRQVPDARRGRVSCRTSRRRREGL